MPIKNHGAVTEPDGEERQAGREGNRSDLSKTKKSESDRVKRMFGRGGGALGAADCSFALW